MGLNSLDPGVGQRIAIEVTAAISSAKCFPSLATWGEGKTNFNTIMHISTGMSLKSTFRSNFLSRAAYASSVAGNMATESGPARTLPLFSMVGSQGKRQATTRPGAILCILSGSACADAGKRSRVLISTVVHGANCAILYSVLSTNSAL